MVTICIPAYNAEKTIARTLDSILTQTYSDIEIFVSDNHSTDKTVQIVESYANKGVKLVKCPDLPIKSGSLLDNCHSSAQNWNSLINYGSGEYIGIYHADDTYEETIVARQVEIFEMNTNCSAVFTLLKRIDENDIIIKNKTAPKFGQRYELFNQFQFLNLIMQKGHFFSTSGVLIKRDIWQKAGKFNGLDYGQASDTEFWLRFSGIAPVVIIYDNLVRYRRSESQDSASWERAYRYQHYAIIKVIEHYLSKFPSDHISFKSKAHFQALKCSDSFRIAINYSEENKNSETKNWLSVIKNLPCNYFVTMYFFHERRALLKIIVGKIWYCSYYFGLDSIIKRIVLKFKYSLFA